MNRRDFLGGFGLLAVGVFFKLPHRDILIRHPTQDFGKNCSRKLMRKIRVALAREIECIYVDLAKNVFSEDASIESCVMKMIGLDRGEVLNARASEIRRRFAKKKDDDLRALRIVEHHGFIMAEAEVLLAQTSNLMERA
ncbi:MAG: hypothetical protein HKN59_01215 [Gammaproteobacteria bacterium]|nr:hypothetical protein [Gammaproteobacteria bacterium]